MTGLDGSFGIGVESTYGTAVTPTRWYPVQSVDLQPDFIHTEDTALMGGGFGPRASARQRVGYGGTGSVEMEVLNKKMALLLEHITGTVVAGSATGSGYTYTMPFTRNTDLMLTCQEGVPNDSANEPYTGVGGKVLSATFSCDMDDTLRLAAEFDFRKVNDTPSLTSPSYTAALQPFTWAQCGVKIGTYGSEAVVDGVSGVSVTLDRPLKVNSRYANSAGLKSQPKLNGRPTVTGTISTDFLNPASFVDRYIGDTAFSLIWEFIGTAGTGYSETFRIALPYCKLDGSLPALDGEDQVDVDIPFTAERDDTNGRDIAIVTYISADATA